MAATPVLERLRRMAPTISVGLLTADWMRLGNELAAVSAAGVQVLHFDVMDGRFCPMLTLGPPVIKAVRTELLKDVHLIANVAPEGLAAYAAAGADILTVHVETTPHPHRLLQAIGELENANEPGRGIARGIALNPGTPLHVVEPLLGETDVVFLLAVNPGWGGQRFVPSTPQRAAQLLDLVRAAGRDVLLGIDGGVTRDNIDSVARMGADLIVTGSAVFDGRAPADNARAMLETIAAVHRNI